MDKVRVALITGGIGDIGTAMVTMLANAEYSHVFALDVNSDEIGKAWLAKLAEKGIHSVHYRQLDVTDFDQCQKVVGDIIAQTGRVDVLVNNAGITQDSVFNKMTKQQWDSVLRVNLDGMFNVTKPVVAQMIAQTSGRIVNISSVNGQRGQYSQANYAASKSGVYGFTKSLAQELIAKHITVNSISPGYVDTRMMQGIRPDILESIIAQIPAKRLAKPEEIAWVVEFLINDKSGYITGSNVSVNGGFYMD